MPRLPEYHRDRGERHWIKSYRDLLPAPPQRLRDLSRWLEVGPLYPSSVLFREDDYLLIEERSLRDRALYRLVVAEVADGASHTEPDRGRVRSRSASRPVPVKGLEEAGLVSRSDDVVAGPSPDLHVG